MAKGSKVLGRFTALALALLVASAAGIVLAAPAADRGGSGYVEMPARVQTEGLTVEQHVQWQEEMSRRLLMEVPKSVFGAPARVVLSPEDLATIESTPSSSTPLKIGLVKPLSPAVEIAGFSFGSTEGLTRSGAMGVAYRLPDGGAVWALPIQAEGAGAIRLHVERMLLPKGAEMYLYSRAGEAFGPYTGLGPDGTGEFWTTTVFGSEAILQVRIAGPTTEGTLRALSFEVQEAGVITKKFVEATAPEAGFCGNVPCIVDASCYSAANSIKDAYAKMEWVAGAFIYTCTGGLLNDSNPTQSNFVLTANHCLSKNTNAKNVNFYWRFRTSSCNGACPSNNGWPYKTTGSTVSASNRKGDFTLLHLNANPPSGSVFLGWTSAPVANTNGAALHRVSNPDFGPQVYNEQSVNTSAPTCSGWPRGERIYSRDTLGGTDGGSSGSPVVNSSDQVVGQLSGACGTNVNDPCDSTNNATVDGAFAFYFSTVQPILAP